MGLGSTHFLQATGVVGGKEWGIPAEHRYVLQQRVCSLTPTPACCTRKQSMNNILLQDICLPALLKMERGLTLEKSPLSRMGWDGCRREEVQEFGNKGEGSKFGNSSSKGHV